MPGRCRHHAALGPLRLTHAPRSLHAGRWAAGSQLQGWRGTSHGDPTAAPTRWQLPEKIPPLAPAQMSPNMMSLRVSAAHSTY